MNRSALTFLLAVATIATFGRVVSNEFVSWDDPDTIVANPRLHPPSLQGASWYWANPAAGLYVPLTYSLWSALAFVSQTRSATGALEIHPWAFHATSLLIHLLGSLVVMDLLRRLLRRDGPALIGAMLFALHPFQVESVAWASGLKDVLCGLLALAAIREYVVYVQEQKSSRYALAMGLLVLGVLAKPTAVVAPLMMLAIDRWVIRRSFRDAFRSLAPMLLLTIPWIIVARVAQKSYLMSYTLWWTRPLIAADALGFYLRRLVFPWPLTVLYGRTPQAVMGGHAIYFAWIVPLVLLSILWLLRRKFTALLAAAAIFVMGLLPVLGLTRFMFQTHSTVADHYMYLPMFGVALAAGWAVSNWEIRSPYAFCGAVLIALAGISFLQAGYWQNSVSLFSHAVDVNPDNDDSQKNLGNALAQIGQLESAIPHFEIAAQVNPRNRVNQELLTQSLVFAHRYKEALPHARIALELAQSEPGSDMSQDEFLLGRTLEQLGQFREAEEHLSEAARRQPNDRNLAAEVASVRRRATQPTSQP